MHSCGSMEQTAPAVCSVAPDRGSFLLLCINGCEQSQSDSDLVPKQALIKVADGLCDTYVSLQR